MLVPRKSTRENDSQQSGVRERNPVKQFTCFVLSGEEYAIDITRTREVVRLQEATPVPQMPPFCLGVINLRGDIVTVFDLRRKFGLPDQEHDEHSRILIVEIDGTAVGIVVDRMGEHTRLKASQIDHAPMVKMKMERECIAGIGELRDRMIIILDLDKVHEFILRDIFGHGTAAEGGSQ